MYRVFFRDKVIDFTYGCASEAPFDPSRDTVAKMLEILENNNTLEIKSPEPWDSFNRFVSLFVPVEAAGGVVDDRSGRTLMIERNGRWDLPKGHLERGETPVQAAIREVKEETGIRNLECGQLITATHHFYPLDGQMLMKRTWWFHMKTTGLGDDLLTPQTEEGISRVQWIPPGEMTSYAESCFASVREVLDRAGKIRL